MELEFKVLQEHQDYQVLLVLLVYLRGLKMHHHLVEQVELE